MKHIQSVKELLDVITKETVFPDIIQQSVHYEALWNSIPKSEHAAKSLDPEHLMQLVEDADKERATLSKLSTNPTQENREAMGVEAKVKEYLTRCPVLNSVTVHRIASKYVEQRGQTINEAPLKKKDAPVPGSDIIAYLAYSSQYEANHFYTAANQRRRNMEAEKKLSAISSLPCEVGSLKFFRDKVLKSDILLTQSELGREILHICATTQDKNLRAEQLKQLRSTLVIPVPGVVDPSFFFYEHLLFVLGPNSCVNFLYIGF